MDSKRGVAKQGVVYLLTGAGTALLELVVFEALFTFLGVNVAVANVIAVVIATATNFLINGTVTFKGSSNPVASLVKYLVLFAFNTTFSTVAISALVDIGVMSLIAKLATMVCIVCWNFVLYKKVVFK